MLSLGRRPHLSFLRTILFLSNLALFLPQATSRAADALPAEWKYVQELTVTAPGLNRLTLPAPTLDAARFDLGDLRLLDRAFRELPYLLERSLPQSARVQDALSFDATLEQTRTILTFINPRPDRIDGITLVTPARRFTKAVQVEASTVPGQWEKVADGQVVFRQADGASQLLVPVPLRAWRMFRLSIDDQRSEPVPFSGARLHAASVSVPAEPVETTIAERVEQPGTTRLVIRLPGAHLHVADLEFRTREPFFTRQVTVLTRELTEAGSQESSVAAGTIYRVAVDEQPASSNLVVHVETRFPSREGVVLVQNHDSPPLELTEIRAAARPVDLVFAAPQAGSYSMLTGNPQGTAPRYDLGELSRRLEGASVSKASLGPISNNPAYRVPETLPGLQNLAAPLDVSAWKYRKRVSIDGPGVYEVDVDLDIWSKARPDLEDLRLVQSGQQLPYILERKPGLGSLTPVLTSNNDPKRPNLSRWSIALPKPALPIARLVFSSPTPLFQRQAILSEQAEGERGDTFVRVLGDAFWTRTPGQPTNELVLALSTRPTTSELFLEIENGDNPPVVLNAVGAFFPQSRLIFKVPTPGELFLHYGYTDAQAPRYDLTLVRQALQSAQRTTASLGTEEVLKPGLWNGLGATESQGPKVIFWGVLGAVIIGLLLVITRLLPGSPKS